VDVNAVGDLVLTDPRAMQILADPFALALHDRLRREGPATIEELKLLGEQEAIETHLKEMEEVGLVERPDETTWAALGKGFVFELPDDPAGQEAARALSRTMLLKYADLPGTWAKEVEPQLELEWARAAGLLNARLLVTPDELRQIQEAFEQAIEPFLSRAEAPDGAAHVRLLSYFMPEG
jgi:DNA-binding transcriptional ArsR family regulator